MGEKVRIASIANDSPGPRVRVSMKKFHHPEYVLESLEQAHHEIRCSASSSQFGTRDFLYFIFDCRFADKVDPY